MYHLFNVRLPINIKIVLSTNPMSPAIVGIVHDGKNTSTWHSKWWIAHPPRMFLQVSKNKCKICVREELASQNRGNSGVQSLAQRTRQLINASALSAAGRLSGAAAGSQSNDRNESSCGRESSKQANTVPAHSLGYKKLQKQLLPKYKFRRASTFCEYRKLMQTRSRACLII